MRWKSETFSSQDGSDEEVGELSIPSLVDPGSFYRVDHGQPYVFLSFCGNRVRQSGTMANDLFVKNRWMLGGILDSFDESKMRTEKEESSKRRRTSTPSNTKASNPALV